MPLKRPLLIFDGECNFCRHIAGIWSHSAGDAVDFRPFQEVAGQFPEIPRQRFDASVQLVVPDGTVYEGAEAVFRLGSLASGGGMGLWAYSFVPGFRTLSEWGYRRVSRNRGIVSFWTRLLLGSEFNEGTYVKTRRWFLISLGVIYALALTTSGVVLYWMIGFLKG